MADDDNVTLFGAVRKISKSAGLTDREQTRFETFIRRSVLVIKISTWAAGIIGTAYLTGAGDIALEKLNEIAAEIIK